jgi:hypothetical protein
MSPEEVFDRIAEASGERARIGAVGNIGGIGHEILHYVYRMGGAGC